MTCSWKTDYQPQIILQKLEESRVAKADGTLSFTSFEFQLYEPVLYSMLLLPDTITERDGRGIVTQSIHKLSQSGPFTAKSLLAEINRSVADLLDRPLKRFVLLTSLSISPEVQLKKVKIGGATIVFGRGGITKYEKHRQKLLDFAKYQFRDQPKDYLAVRVYISAKTVDEAAENALKALDLLRGIWNFYLNRPHSIRISFGANSPVNQIILGPIHSLHLLNGELAIQSWWYDPGYISPRKVLGKVDQAKFSKFLENVRKALKRSNYRSDVENAIVTYNRALDDTNWHGAFLKLWSVLEELTDTEGSYKVTIRRAAFLYSERELSQEILRHLKDYRNRFVHEAADNDEIETYLYQLKNFVERLVEFHLGNRFGFKSIKEAGEFLEMPTSKDALDYRLRTTAYAIKYLRLA